MNRFALLKNTGDPVRDVRRFLRAAGRLDTLRHAAQVNAVGRRLWFPLSRRERGAGGEGRFAATSRPPSSTCATPPPGRISTAIGRGRSRISSGCGMTRALRRSWRARRPGPR